MHDELRVLQVLQVCRPWILLVPGGRHSHVLQCCSYYARILHHTKWIVCRNGRRSWRRPINTLAHTWYIRLQRCILRTHRDSINYDASISDTSTLKMLWTTVWIDTVVQASCINFVVQHGCKILNALCCEIFLYIPSCNSMVAACWSHHESLLHLAAAICYNAQHCRPYLR